MKADWEKLLQNKRFRNTRSSIIDNDARNHFDNDYSRIILSPHFRRLQDKAQVFPYDDSDFVRTRLTHSIEVSCFARSLGLAVEKRLYELKELPEKSLGYIPSLLSTAGLLHDIGNPPFGHFGETCIQDFFTHSEILDDLNEEEKNDFLKFEGNPQTLRILRKLGPAIDEYSYNLTFPTLSSIIKYPHSSISGNKQASTKSSEKKFGYFQAEKDDFQIISDSLGLGNKRHPLVFLLEAADDIAYSVSDIEDGCKKGIITEKTLRDNIDKNLLGSEKENEHKVLDEYKNKIPKDHPADFILLIQYYRIRSQSSLIVAAVDCFINNYERIINGEFDEDLVLASDAANIRKLFKKLAKNNFNHPTVLKRELAGQAALKFHLKYFTDSLFSESKDDTRTIPGKFNALVSKNYEFINNKFEKYGNEKYKKLLLITDFISGMTDTYAIKLFHELSGIAPF